MPKSALLSQPDDIIQYKRNLASMKHHNDRVRATKSCIDMSTPESLGLKHLKTRAKKKQLNEDRNQHVATENRKLMENMIKIMSDPRKQKPHVFLDSLNERERAFYVENVNRGNEVMFERLKATKPVLGRKKMEDDFNHHQKFLGYMQRKSRFALPKISAKTEKSELFDSDAYASMNSSGMDDPNFGTGLTGSPIQSMADFRKNVLSQKRAPNLNAPRQDHSKSMTRTESEGGGGSSVDRGGVRFEMTHEPTGSA
jgi:hypothetical protein